MILADTVTLVLADSTNRYGLSAVRRLQVSQGFRSHAVTGAGIGFLVGAGVTYVAWRDFCDRSKNQDAADVGVCLGIAALGGAAGAGLGAIIGGLHRTERWQDVPIDRLRVSRGAQGGISLRLSVAF